MTVKVPVLMQLVVEVDQETNEQWEIGDEATYGRLEAELTKRLNVGDGPIKSVSRVKFIDVGEMNVDLQ
jgi:hypothetical protein